MFISKTFGKRSAFWRNRRKIRAAVWLAVLVLLAVSGAVGFILASNEPRIVEVTPIPSEVPAGADGSKIAKGAEIEWEYEYRMCGHTIYLSCIADESMTGLTFSQLQAEHPDARIVSFEPDRVVLKMSFDRYCPRHYILKRYRDELAVFRTVLGSDEQERYREVHVRFDDLSVDEQEVLEAGKLFESIDDMENYLENLEF